MEQIRFKVLFSIFIGFLLLFDFVILRKRAIRAWGLLLFVFGLTIITAFYQWPIIVLSKMIGIGRGVDLVIYFVFVVLVRELFLSRIKLRSLEQQNTVMIREYAIHCSETKEILEC